MIDSERRIPLGLFDDVGDRRIAEDKSVLFHRLRARSRRAGINPLRRISATGGSIFGPLAAATSSCSRLLRRRSLVLPNQFANILARRSPIARSDLPFDVLFEWRRGTDVAARRAQTTASRRLRVCTCTARRSYAPHKMAAPKVLLGYQSNLLRDRPLAPNTPGLPLSALPISEKRAPSLVSHLS